jgi:hypothetical protein
MVSPLEFIFTNSTQLAEFLYFSLNKTGTMGTVPLVLDNLNPIGNQKNRPPGPFSNLFHTILMGEI